MSSRLSRGYLLGHVLEDLGQGLLDEGQLGGSPDLSILDGQRSVSLLLLLHGCETREKRRGRLFVSRRGRRGKTHGLEVLLDLGGESAGLEGNDLGGGVGVVSDGGAALGAEEAPDGVAGGALALPLLDGAVDGELVLGDDGDEGWGGVLVGCLIQRLERIGWVRRDEQ